MSALNSSAVAPRASRVVALCFLVAVFEGFDIQSMGVAASGVAAEFHLRLGQLGLALAASVIGLAIGAAIGGRASDLVGRRIVLLLSMVGLGVFSFATTLAWDEGSLLGARLLTGLALGSAFPNLIAAVADSTSLKQRPGGLALMYCGMPLGGIVAGLVAFGATQEAWRTIFYVGSLGPMLVAPLLLLLPRGTTTDARVASGQPAIDIGAVLFGERTRATLLIWVSYFFTLLFVYLLLSWLPSLLVVRGLGRQAGLLASVALNGGAIVGSLVLGGLIVRGAYRQVVPLTYLGMAVSVGSLAVTSNQLIFVAAFFCGLFVIGGQLVLYAMTPHFYEHTDRGTGVGAAVAVGRLGSILGPILAGTLIGAGYTPAMVLLLAMPGLLIAFGAAVALSRFTDPATISG